MSSVTPGFIVKTAPEFIVMEVPDGIVTSEVKVISTVIIQASISRKAASGGMPV